MNAATEIELEDMIDELDDLSAGLADLAYKSAKRLPPRVRSIAEMFKIQQGETVQSYAARHWKTLGALRKTRVYRKAARALEATKRARVRWFQTHPEAKKLQCELRKLAAKYKNAVLGSPASTPRLKEQFVEILDEFL